MIPENNIFGGSFYIQNINEQYKFQNTLTLKYPIHNIYLEAGLYTNIDKILENIQTQLNKDHLLVYDWSSRDWIEKKKNQKDYLIHNKKMFLI